MSFASSIAAQRAIITANEAESVMIKANQAQQNLIGARGSLNDISRQEARLEAKKEQARTKAQAAYAENKALKNARKHKINYMA